MFFFRCIGSHYEQVKKLYLRGYVNCCQNSSNINHASFGFSTYITVIILQINVLYITVWVLQC